MRTIYYDSEYKCHTVNDGTMTAVETDSFDGKCDAYIEGFCYDTSKGYVHVYPWKPYIELDAAQREYEKQLLAEYKFSLSEMAMLWAQQIMLGNKTYAQVPQVLKESVKEILIESGYENLVVE